MSKRVFLQSGIIASGLNIYFDVQDEDGDIYDVSTDSAFVSPDVIDYPTDAATTMPEVGSTSQYEADFPDTIDSGQYEINVKQRVGGAPAFTDPVIKSLKRYWNDVSLLDPSYASVLGAGAVSATFVENAWIWRFDDRDQMTAVNTINEIVEFEGLLGMTFDRVISKDVTIQSASVVSINGDTGTGSGVDITGDVLLSPNKRTVHIPVLVYDDGEYIFAVKITTTDTQSYIRRGILAVQPIIEV